MTLAQLNRSAKFATVAAANEEEEKEAAEPFCELLSEFDLPSRKEFDGTKRSHL